MGEVQLAGLPANDVHDDEDDDEGAWVYDDPANDVDPGEDGDDDDDGGLSSKAEGERS